MYGTGLARGLTVTLKNLVMPGRFFTVHQYPSRRVGPLGLARMSGTNVVGYCLRNPGRAIKAMLGLVTVEDRDPRHSRFRGQEFNFYEQRCTGCASCAKYCPLGIIKIVTNRSGEAMQEGQKYGLEVFDIDIGRCMFCGLCVEACPYDALHMGSTFEEGDYRRRGLVIDIDRLREAPKRPSTWFRPQLEARGYDPGAGEEVPWQEVGRHERPTTGEQSERWARR